MTLHYVAGSGLDDNGNYLPAQDGFNLADVQSVDQVNNLPTGVKGLVWLDQTHGVTQAFIDAVTPFINNPNVQGFYLADEPDPTGQFGPKVNAADLKAESDWIHAHDPGAKTFITMMAMGSSENPNFTNTFNPANTDIDYFGIDPYPVRSGSVEYDMIDKAVAAAVKSGIPVDDIVPVFQAFGGGGWVNDQDGKYVVPTAAQEQQILDHWANLVPSPAFDYVYHWNSQNGDTALESSPELQAVFKAHNADGTVTDPPAPPTGDPGTGGGTGGNTGSGTGGNTGSGTGGNTGSGTGGNTGGDTGGNTGSGTGDTPTGGGGHGGHGHGGHQHQHQGHHQQQQQQQHGHHNQALVADNAAAAPTDATHQPAQDATHQTAQTAAHDTGVTAVAAAPAAASATADATAPVDATVKAAANAQTDATVKVDPSVTAANAQPHDAAAQQTVATAQPQAVTTAPHDAAQTAGTHDAAVAQHVDPVMPVQNHWDFHWA